MDEQLARWKKGDFDAFAALLDPYLTSLRAYAAWCSPPAGPWAQEELIQDALVEAFHSARSYHPAHGSLEAWFQNVVRERIRRAWQEHARHSRRHTPAMRQLTETCARAFEVQKDSAPLLKAVSECLERLAPERRALLAGLYTEGLTGAELAARQGVPAGMIYQSIHRIHREIRERVDESLQGKPPA